MDGQCALCTVKSRCCRTPGGDGPRFCSTQLYPDALEKASQAYADPEVQRFAHAGAVQEQSCYQLAADRPGVVIPQKPRITETVEFAQRMAYKRLGLAFCGGLHQEAAVVSKILTSEGFQVISAMCKVGCVDKSQIGVEESDKINRGGHESMCNPIAQAEILNSAQTDFNVLLGLCVGHDSLFLKYSEAPCTVFAVKDRLLGHNPLAAIYTIQSNYRFLIK